MDFIWIAIAAFLGSVLTTMMYRTATGGTLNIDRSNPEKDVYLFDIDEAEFEKLPKRRYILLKINPNADLSHK